MRKPLDRKRYLLGRQRHPVHDAPRSTDFLFRYAPVRLGDVPHNAERRLEEEAARPGRAFRARAAETIAEALIELMAEHEAK